MSDKPNKEIGDILKRLQRLEETVFSAGKKAALKKQSGNEFSGPKGGALLLISKGFFSRQKNAAQVVTELETLGYIGYQRQVVQNALNRLSANKGQLIASTEEGVRMYAKRK
jgi:hypothetical protein